MIAVAPNFAAATSAAVLGLISVGFNPCALSAVERSLAGIIWMPRLAMASVMKRVTNSAAFSGAASSPEYLVSVSLWLKGSTATLFNEPGGIRIV